MEKEEAKIAPKDAEQLPTHYRKPAAKKRGPLGLLRAAALLVRGRSPAKKAIVVADAVDPAVDAWKTLVGGVRPLVHQLEYPAPLTPPPVIISVHESFHDVAMPPPSPGSSVDGMSRYASAEDLQSLDAGEEDDGGAPHAIDLQAEEFIAKFYEQMRLQRLESFNQNAC